MLVTVLGALLIPTVLGVDLRYQLLRLVTQAFGGDAPINFVSLFIVPMAFELGIMTPGVVDPSMTLYAACILLVALRLSRRWSLQGAVTLLAAGVIHAPAWWFLYRQRELCHALGLENSSLTWSFLVKGTACLILIPIVWWVFRARAFILAAVIMWFASIAINFISVTPSWVIFMWLGLNPGLVWHVLLAAVFGWLAWHDQRAWIPMGHCPSCGYNMSASQNPICPECGEFNDRDWVRPRVLGTTPTSAPGGTPAPAPDRS